MSENSVSRYRTASPSGILFGLAGFAAVAGVWLAVRWLAQSTLIGANQAAFAARPEIENWADPVAGTQWSAILIASVITLATLVVVGLIMCLRRSSPQR
ncbi:hypothetical protein [Glaciibacter flavus]|uniref:hypothetical protein n=1 Tax=Orlajensenia flava TaxID=2565934 RepID=UPI003AFFB49B